MINTFFSSLDEYSIDTKEYCFLMEDTSKYSHTFKVFIPKVMPLFNVRDNAKEWKENFKSDIFVNDEECKVNIKPFVELQNYFSIRRSRNSWFRFHPTTIRKMTRLLCEIPERNIRHIRVLDEDFNVDSADLSGNVYVKSPLYEILDKIDVGDTVNVSYDVYIRVPIGDYEGDSEMGPTGIDNSDFDFSYEYTSDDGTHIHPLRPVNSSRTYYRKRIMTVEEGTVVSKEGWGLVVSLSAGNRYILPANIIGFYKKASEYYSYYQDSYYGGETR